MKVFIVATSYMITGSFVPSALTRLQSLSRDPVNGEGQLSVPSQLSAQRPGGAVRPRVLGRLEARGLQVGRAGLGGSG